MKGFGLQLSKRRIAKKLSRKDLSDRTGISNSYISNLENGVGKELNIYTIEKLASALDAAVDELFIDSLDYFHQPTKIEKITSIVQSLNEKQCRTFLKLVHEYKNSKE